MPDDWSGWRIYGHVHNGNLDDYPFIDAENQTINISAEVLDYTPISVSQLVKLLEKEETYKRLACSETIKRKQ
ncbi:hypothetical protein EFA46_007675 [Halarchaeum sp. CBA1220]|uniref:hypothetical protein n=1 Tax=Halarchaeum sp. CBA1220 TaxID=1853682 RepID=UPI0011CE8CF1|nr:hypothetical protein [Halarchaeum sp. CBA1220]QLC34087.1 hypothetical protein EFA46_007675 [Halarchaeum sp. CBA1220]